MLNSFQHLFTSAPTPPNTPHCHTNNHTIPSCRTRFSISSLLHPLCQIRHTAIPTTTPFRHAELVSASLHFSKHATPPTTPYRHAELVSASLLHPLRQPHHTATPTTTPFRHAERVSASHHFSKHYANHATQPHCSVMSYRHAELVSASHHFRTTPHSHTNNHTIPSCRTRFGTPSFYPSLLKRKQVKRPTPQNGTSLFRCACKIFRGQSGFVLNELG